MMNIGYNNRWVRLVKDLLFVGLGVWLITKTTVLTVLVGIFALAWYGRDAWFQAKALWQEKHYQAPAPERPQQEDGKITLSNPSDIKDADYTKE